MCSIYGSSGRCHGNACRMNEVLVLVFNREEIWLFKGIVFSPKFRNSFSAKSESFDYRTMSQGFHFFCGISSYGLFVTFVLRDVWFKTAVHMSDDE